MKADEAHDAAVKAQAVMEAAAQRLQDAQRLQAAVYQEGSLEVKLVEMRRFTGRAWAAQWFLECGELLGLLSEMPSGDKTSRMREVLTHRIEALRSAYPQDFAEALTPQRAAGFNAVLDAIEAWSKNAEAADKGLALVRAEEIKAVNAFHEAQAADVRASARLRAAQESLEQLQAQQRESAERLQVRRDAFLLAAKHCFAADTDSKAVLAEPQSFLNEAEARRQRYAAADASAQKAQEKLTAASAAANAAAAQKRGADEAQTAASERAQAAHQAAQDVRKDRENKFGKRSAQAERRELAHRVRTSREKERNAAQASAQAAQHLKTIEATLSAEKRRRKSLHRKRKMPRRGSASFWQTQRLPMKPRCSRPNAIPPELRSSNKPQRLPARPMQRPSRTERRLKETWKRFCKRLTVTFKRQKRPRNWPKPTRGPVRQSVVSAAFASSSKPMMLFAGKPP